MAPDNKSDRGISGAKSTTQAVTETKQYQYLPPTPELRSGLSMMEDESTKDKFIRKFYEQPLVPIGCGLTAGALTFGLINMKSGNRFMSQRMMRLRILAQGFTVFACLAGVFYTAKSRRDSTVT